MTLAQLQVLAAVVELGSLTAAAERLSRSQSAISHALTELEEITQVKLLMRDRQPVGLTAAGERLWPYVRNVVREAQTLRQQFSLSRGKLEGRLVVASLLSVSLAFVVPALEALKEMHRIDSSTNHLRFSLFMVIGQTRASSPRMKERGNVRRAKLRKPPAMLATHSRIW